MRTILRAAGFGALLVLAGAAQALAHHSFSGEFDINRPIQLTGTVARVEWINPHAWIHVDVKKPDGTIETWAIETGTPNTLLRRGLRRQDLPAGTEVKVTGYQARDGTAKANGTNVTLPDGRALFIGSGGPGAPTK
jgi:DNA/RNA endonuclease YhcR with UshA esterase domain